MRGLLADLPTPVPLAGLLPSMLRDDRFAQGICAGLDDLLAPVHASLDSFWAYLDLQTTPDDVLPWLGQWLGVAPDDSRGVADQRRMLSAAGDLYRGRGTPRGLALAVRAALGVDAEVTESGGCGWSVRAGGPLPGDPTPGVTVTVRPGPGEQVDPVRLDAVVRAACPAHLPYRVEVVAPG